MKRFFSLVIGGTIGALLAYFLDPARGPRRRIQTRDQLAGLRARVVHLRSGRPAGDDVTIADRVESEVFRATGLPKGGVSLDVNDGIVVLRGELPRQNQIDELERATRRISGVRGVENLLHITGTPSPRDIEARRAGSA